MIIVWVYNNESNENKQATIVQISCLLLLLFWNSPRIHNFTQVIKIEIEIKTTLASYNTHIKQQNKHIDVMHKHMLQSLFSLTCERQKTTCVLLCLNICSTKILLNKHKSATLRNTCDNYDLVCKTVCVFDTTTASIDRPMFVSCLIAVWISTNQYWLFYSILILCVDKWWEQVKMYKSIKW